MNQFNEFIEVMSDASRSVMILDFKVQGGDSSRGYHLSVRPVSTENGHHSNVIAIKVVSPFAFKLLITLCEIDMGPYGTVLNANAYHQACDVFGGRVANNIIAVQQQALEVRFERSLQLFIAREAANRTKADDGIENKFEICERLSQNPRCKVRRPFGGAPFNWKYRCC